MLDKRKSEVKEWRSATLLRVPKKRMSQRTRHITFLLLTIIWMASPEEVGGSGVVAKMRRSYNTTTVAKIKESTISANGTMVGSHYNKTALVNSTASSPSQVLGGLSPLSGANHTTHLKGDFEALKLDNSSQIKESPEEKLKQALLNHTLHLREMDLVDKDLDHMVFSQLPEGSKLILRTVKIVRTDEDGDDDDSGEESTSWDVTVTNGTESDENSSRERPIRPRQNSDLLGAASHARSHYKNDGSSHRTKEKENKYFNHQDHGKNHKITLTDTDGKKKKKYDGVERGVTDYANAHGNAQSNEGGRYKDSKKKNKGRKVTGFKRVYHKEEFQRTEHFYDDEEAKRIAENFGANDAKEQSSHGLKDDDRKYHGTYREKTEGEKVKNEHETKNGHHKGHHQAHKTNEKLVHGEHYANEQAKAHGQQHQPKYHENHNYHGAYSNTHSKVADSKGSRRRPSTSTTDSTSASSSEPGKISTTAMPALLNGGDRPRRPNRLKLNRLRQRQNPGLEQSMPNLAMTAPRPTLKKPSEMKVFFSPRERHFPFSPHDATMAYAPNFVPAGSPSDYLMGPPHSAHTPPQPHHHNHHHPHPLNYGYNLRTIHPMQALGLKTAMSAHRNESAQGGPHGPRYASIFGKGIGPDQLSPGYSTLTKTHPKGVPPTHYNGPRGNLLSIDKATGLELITDAPSTPLISTTDSFKYISSGTPPHQVGWIPLGSSSNGMLSDPHIPSYPHFTHLRVGKTLVPTMLIRSPSTVTPVATVRRPPPPPPPPPHSTPGYSPSASSPTGTQPVSTMNYNAHLNSSPIKGNPAQFSHFMNGLMDSVAGFFGRIG